MSNDTTSGVSQFENISVGGFVASVGVGLAVFGAEIAGFYLLKLYLPRIYRPRTYLLPERERTSPPPPGWFQWVVPIFTTPNSEFIHKCGLDAFFFLRYLRLLLKIFVPMACLLMPILLPINATGTNARPGLSRLSWGNINKTTQAHRYWAHLVLAVVLIVYSCYIFFGELRSYVRVRQAYLTSPQHRLRASATTVLVSSIPSKWMTVEALDGLFDVFPGGIRNIWLNRNFDKLNDKVKLRDKLAKKLESAETNLVKNAKQKQKEMAKKDAKKQKSSKKMSKEEKKMEQQALDGAGERLALSDTGLSAGNPHQLRTLREFLHKEDDVEETREQSPTRDRRTRGAFGYVGHGLGEVGGIVGGVGSKVGQGLGLGLGAVAHGAGRFGLSKAGRAGDQQPAVVAQTDAADERTDAEGDSPHPSEEQLLDHSNERSKEDLSEKDKKTAASHQQETSELESPKQDAHKSPLHSGSFPQKSPGFAPPPHHIPRRENLAELTDLDRFTETHWKFWTHPAPLPSPYPHMRDDALSPSPSESASEPLNAHRSDGSHDDPHSRKGEDEKGAIKQTTYPLAYDETLSDAPETDAVWQKYLKPNARDHMRLRAFGLSWMPFLPCWMHIGKKVDTIYYCRKEVARLNLEIEYDQKHPENFPLMNSAFIQFNHQVAAHMACQAISHHLPQHMAPRLIEISPDDVIWDNMAIKWWERYLRTGLAILITAAIVVLYAIPSAFAGGLSQLSMLEDKNGFHWVASLPSAGVSILQGVLPPAIQGLLFFLVPVILILLHRLQGLQTGNGVQLMLQNSFFAFLFVQLFLVTSIAASAASILGDIGNAFRHWSQTLGDTIPSAANYFFNYMILQALSVSAGALLQIGALFGWFLLAPLVDGTPRKKWRRQINLPSVRWGTFFPVYTNLAVIGIIYSVIAPLILLFNVITFTLFWVAYRYNTLYVNKFKFDTGGLLFPTAVNQLFVGLYAMELILIIGFFLITEAKPQAIIMIVVLVLTALYQWLLNSAFGPLFQYLPITLEDEAVMRDEEFERAQGHYWSNSGDDDALPAAEEAEEHQGALESGQGDEVPSSTRTRTASALSPTTESTMTPRKSWADRSHSGQRSSRQNTPRAAEGKDKKKAKPKLVDAILNPVDANKQRDLESQSEKKNEAAEYLYGGLSDEIEDLRPEERDALVDRAFRHKALRARRPVIWIPRDDLGVSDDEVRRTSKLTDHIWISNEGTALDAKGRALYRRQPPDFSEIDLIEL